MALARRFRPLPYGSFTLDDPFWSPLLDRLAEVTLPRQYEQISQATPRLENFRRAAARSTGGFQGRYYDDSDTYKWLEACAYALAHRSHAPLRAMADEAIALILAAQEEDGYLDTFFQLEHPDLKFRNLAMMHELYCMGHFLEAAVAWQEALGDGRLMQGAERMVELLVRTFGPGGRPGSCGHEEVELGLLRYADATGDERARDLARQMIETRGRRPSTFEAELADSEAIALSPWAQRMLCRNGSYAGDYIQDHAPIREHRIVVGHAVRAMYLYTAAVPLASGDAALEEALRAVWRNMTERRMYITGGIGSTAANEGFTHDYDLPNHNGYAETCASVGLALWGRALLEHSGEGEFADAMERAIFNGALAGLSESGDRYFYENPLESRFDHERTPWFECACCPPNVARMIGSIATFAMGASSQAVWLHFPIGGRYRAELDGGAAEFAIRSGYPQSGRFELEYRGPERLRFELRVRLPGWCPDAAIELSGESPEAEYEEGYIVLRREWSPGESLAVDWQMEPRWMESHPMLFDNLGKVALTRGPLVYCHESLDPARPAQHFSADLDSDPETLEDGRIQVAGSWLQRAETEELYSPVGDLEFEEGQAPFLPYCRWANRGRSSMTVWTAAG